MGLSFIFINNNNHLIDKQTRNDYYLAISFHCKPYKDFKYQQELMAVSIFNSIQFILYSPISQITNLASEGFAISKHTISLSQDLISDQEKLPQKSGRASGEQQRRIPLPG